MTITSDDLDKLATLARLRVNASERGEVTERIDRILGMVQQLQAVDTEGVEPLANPLDATQRLRPDQVTDSDQRERFQALAPAVEDGLYLVPKVIE